jgi:hypothetical protein
MSTWVCNQCGPVTDVRVLGLTVLHRTVGAWHRVRLPEETLTQYARNLGLLARD